MVGNLIRDLGESTARKFLDAHELAPRQPADEKAMDEFNNEAGIRAATALLKIKNFEDSEFFDLAADEIRKGNLKIINYEKRNEY